MNTCLHCGVTFKPKNKKYAAKQKYCTLACYSASRRIPRKACSVCGKENNGHKNVTCSRACSNKLFKRGPKRNPLGQEYHRHVCFDTYPRVCVVCGYSKIVAVHHFDGDHSNNAIENLVPLCNNCHAEVHSTKYRDEVQTAIENWRKIGPDQTGVPVP